VKKKLKQLNEKLKSRPRAGQESRVEGVEADREDILSKGKAISSRSV
jgi:hypothetical protein